MKILILLLIALGFTAASIQEVRAADLPRRRAKAEIYVAARRLPPAILWSPDLNEECSLPSESCRSSVDCCGQASCIQGYCGGPTARMHAPVIRPAPSCNACSSPNQQDDSARFESYPADSSGYDTGRDDGGEPDGE